MRPQRIRGNSAGVSQTAVITLLAITVLVLSTLLLIYIFDDDKKQDLTAQIIYTHVGTDEGNLTVTYLSQPIPKNSIEIFVNGFAIPTSNYTWIQTGTDIFNGSIAIIEYGVMNNDTIQLVHKSTGDVLAETATIVPSVVTATIHYEQSSFAGGNLTVTFITESIPRSDIDLVIEGQIINAAGNYTWAGGGTNVISGSVMQMTIALSNGSVIQLVRNGTGDVLAQTTAVVQELVFGQISFTSNQPDQVSPGELLIQFISQPRPQTDIDIVVGGTTLTRGEDYTWTTSGEQIVSGSVASITIDVSSGTMVKLVQLPYSNVIAATTV